MKAYCGYIKDESVLLRSASGGLATAMSKKVLSDGGAVYGAAYTCDFRDVEYIRVDKEHDLVKLQSSKYTKAKLTLAVFTQIVEDLAQRRKVLFVGVPCDVNVVKQYMKKNGVDTSSLITVDLICHGTADTKVVEQFVDYLEKKYKSKIVEFTTRYADTDWAYPLLYAKFENGKVYKKSFYLETEYGAAMSFMLGKRCFECPFKGEQGHIADITIGDYWGATPKDAGYNNLGTSVAFVYDKVGEDFLMSLSDFALFEADKEKALKGNPMYSRPASKPDKLDWFKTSFEQEGLIKTARKHIGIKGFVKNLIPFSLRLKIKKALKH